MKILIALGAAAVALTSAVSNGPRSHAFKTVPVVVHCPNGANPAGVTPPEVHIAVGDSLLWRMTGTVLTDTLEISLKEPKTPWPFSGKVPAGHTSARSGRAITKGTYKYNINLSCRAPGGGSTPVLIDPDIIIE